MLTLSFLHPFSVDKLFFTCYQQVDRLVFTKCIK
jgi:hypothetical protein